MSQIMNGNGGYCSQNNNMDFGRMFDQYTIHKGSENFDLSLTIPESSAQQQYMGDQQGNHYGAYESGVVRPNTADSGYQEMNPMTSPPLGSHEAPQPAPMSAPQQHPHPPQGMYQMGQVPGLHHGNNPQFPPQNLYIPPISQHGSLMAAQTAGGYIGQNMGHAAPVYTNAGLGMPVHHPPPPHHMMATAGPGMIPANYYQGQRAPPVAVTKSGGSPTSGGSPSPGSEDSDDSNSLNQGNRAKRPSPEVPAEPVAPVRGKKARVSKKSKKKKDPNEPQKPVSAYALFFRDTQAAIKGQNPNASFGEVSKIVASMWDGLEPDNKSVYKKKTEAAKKDYLKALAAYRASFVSKGGEGDPMYAGTGQPFGSFGANAPPSYGYPTTTNAGSMPTHPQGHSPPQLSPLAKKSPLLSSLMTTEAGGQQTLMNPPMSQPMPPSAPSMMGHMIPPSSQAPPPATAPIHPSHQPCPPIPQGHIPHMASVPATSPYMTKNNSSLGSPLSSNDVGGSPGAQQQQHALHKQQPAQNPSQPQQQQQQQQQQPPPAPQTTPQTQISPQHQISPHHHGQPQVPQNTPANTDGIRGCNNGSCIRAGCTNAAVHNAEWEDEYCSNECVVSHCRDVFNTWVAGNPTNAPTYPAPVK